MSEPGMIMTGDELVADIKPVKLNETSGTLPSGDLGRSYSFREEI